MESTRPYVGRGESRERHHHPEGEVRLHGLVGPVTEGLQPSEQVSGDGAFGEQGVVRDPRPVHDGRRDAEPAECGYEDWGVTPTS